MIDFFISRTKKNLEVPFDTIEVSHNKLIFYKNELVQFEQPIADINFIRGDVLSIRGITGSIEVKHNDR